MSCEAEIDAISDGDQVHVMGIMEHIEPAGIHSCLLYTSDAADE